jgi:hypothetical protein
MKLASMFIVLGSVGPLACAGAPPPPPVVVRANDLGALKGIDPRTTPIVIEVLPGDEVPFVLKVEGDLVDTLPDQPKITLRARRHFFVRFGKGGLQLSLDGRDWDPKNRAPGAFQFGLGATPEGPRAGMTVTTPTFEK